ncbi:GNAT family N-acetyltransferase [Nocardia sp. NEAU-G5]|uniref:GNAT family N-acetyltransferase n=1 Tax=Nocardia albiluteola TaxID=2842303 RepID=A0ABS6BC26_9NOCA|nr:GNAT family N-acetyltransferase [Nocardia albiluteola]MBU3067839.1 GNAT family N-acetyltransferase [Nocardia albiluteola]
MVHPRGSWLDESESADPAQTRQRLAARLAPAASRIWTVRRLDEAPALGLAEVVGGGPVPWLSWMLRRSHWRQGIMGEAVATVVEHLIAVEGVPLLEAWTNATVHRRTPARQSSRATVDSQGRTLPRGTFPLGLQRAPDRRCSGRAQ